MNSKQIAQALLSHPATSAEYGETSPERFYIFAYSVGNGQWVKDTADSKVDQIVSERVVRIAVTKALAASGTPFNGASLNLAIDMLKAGVS